MIRQAAFSFLGVLLFLPLQAEDLLTWKPLPPLPSPLGVAGPYTGLHNNALLVAGGANFPEPVWENDKVWRDAVYALPLEEGKAEWQLVGSLPRPLGYGTTVSVPEGVICIGGNDAARLYADVFLLHWDGGPVETQSLPPLPSPLCYSSSAMIGNFIYVAGGQTGPGLETATSTFLRLDWSQRDNPDSFQWEKLSPWPGSPRAFSSLVAQSNGDSPCLYLVGGRNLNEAGETVFLPDLYEFDPTRKDAPWKKKQDLPAPLAAGTAVAFGEHTLVTLAGADGSLFTRGEELRENHPGFPKMMFAYDTVADQWTEAGSMPQNQVTTEAVSRDGEFFLLSGEIRPRVRTPQSWHLAAYSGNSANPPRVSGRILFLVLLIGIPLSILVAYRSRNRPRAGR